MSSILKVDQLQDSGGNSIITSDGAGNITPGSLNIGNSQIASNAAIATTKLGTGAVIQRVSNQDYSTTISGSTSTYLGSGVTITPSSSSNDILILVTGVCEASGADVNQYADIQLHAGTTNIITFYHAIGYRTNSASRQDFSTAFFHSPATTSATQYRVYHLYNTGSQNYIYRHVNISAIEVAG